MVEATTSSTRTATAVPILAFLSSSTVYREKNPSSIITLLRAICRSTIERQFITITVNTHIVNGVY